MIRQFNPSQNLKFLAYDYQINEIVVVRALQLTGSKKFAVLGREDSRYRVQEYVRDLSEIEVLQFTNERDNKNFEIYEHDILSFPEGVIFKTRDYTGVVVRKGSCFMIHNQKLTDVIKHARKRGNIHVNYEKYSHLLSRVDRKEWNPDI